MHQHSRHFRISFLLAFSALVLFLSCSKKDGGSAPASPFIGILDCPAASGSGTPTAGSSFTGSFTVPYSGGNGVAYGAGSPIASTGVTGLTATLQPGTLANGNGNLQFTVSGTPSSNGVAAFAISFATRTCTVQIHVNDLPPVQYGTPFLAVPDRQDAVIYQVNMRAFSSQSNFQGVIDRLDSIQALGINVIYLMPIYPVGTVNSVNSPYSVRDYRSVNPEFGSLADLRALVDGAHSRNMSVLLDWVANHTAWDHPWISSHPDWYVRNGAGSIISPPGTGWNDVAQLNFSNSAMRQEMIRSMKYWIHTANIDGFRFDYADGPPFDFWKQAIDTLRNISTHRLLLLAEGSRSDHFTAGFDFTFGFSFYGQLKDIYAGNAPATAIDGVNQSEYTNAVNGQQVVRYITNHDVNSSDGTPAERFGGQAGAMGAFVVAAFMKGVPMIYNGQEVGTPFRLLFPFTGADIDWSLNPQIKAEYKRLIAFRNSSAAIRRGTVTSYNTPDVICFTKELGAEKVFVAVNVRNATTNFIIPGVAANSTWTHAITNSTVNLGTTLPLPPYAYLILKK